MPNTQLDSALGLKKESTFGTYIAPDAFYEFISHDFAWNPTFAGNSATRYGKRVDRADRRVLVKSEVGGSFDVEVGTQGLGKLFGAAFGGTPTSTLITGTSYQQVFTPTNTDPLDSYTIQASVPLLGGGAPQPMSYLGCVCGGFELSAGNAAIPTLKFKFVGKSVDTAQSFATPSYTAGTRIMSFVQSSITIGGAVTVPTTTTLATGGTVVGDVLDINLTYDNGLDAGGFFIGGSGTRGRRPSVLTRQISGSLTAEFDTITLRDAYLNQTDLALVLQFQDPTIISGTNKSTLQITIPNIRLDGELPKPNNNGTTTITVPFTGLDGGVASSPIYVAIVTAETAI